MPRGTDGSKSEEDKTASSSACKCNVCDPLGLPWHELRRELLRIAGLLVKGHPGAQTILLPLSCPSEPRSTPQASNATGQRALRPGATRKLYLGGLSSNLIIRAPV